MENLMLVLCFILIVALGVSLGLWFAHHITFDVDYNGAPALGGYGPNASLSQAA
jgi:hypothetical protein